MGEKNWGILLRWLIVVGVGVIIYILPRPEGITRESWTLLAIFIATIVGSIVQPLTAGAIVLMGVMATVVFGALKPADALKGYSEPVVWLVLAAFFLSIAMIKTGLGRRIALLLVKAIGGRTIGLGYALVSTDFILASMVPSNGARNGGVLMPVALGICETYESRPEDGTENKLGAFLFNLLYQCDVIISATFITGQASNLIIAKLVQETTGITLTYQSWLAAAIIPSLVSLAIVPWMIYRFFPPGVKRTPEATSFAATELKKQGPTTRNEKLVLGVLAAVVALWVLKDRVHNVDVAIIALGGIGVLLITRVIDWRDLMSDSNAWSTFIWYGGLVNMATFLGETGITKLFAQWVSTNITGMSWAAALALMALIFFFVHYFFASITGHVLAMFVPFVTVTILAGAPAGLTVLLLAYFANLSAGLTHYGTTPGPIYYGLGYVRQTRWWTIGLIAAIINIAVWSTIGLGWWRLLGWW